MVFLYVRNAPRAVFLTGDDLLPSAERCGTVVRGPFFLWSRFFLDIWVQCGRMGLRKRDPHRCYRIRWPVVWGEPHRLALLCSYRPSLQHSGDEKMDAKLYYPVKLEILRILPVMPANPKNLYLFLCSHADFKTGHCWPTYRTILEGTKMTKNKEVKRAIDYLVELGLIDTWREGRRRYYKITQ